MFFDIAYIPYTAILKQTTVVLAGCLSLPVILLKQQLKDAVIVEGRDIESVATVVILLFPATEVRL